MPMPRILIVTFCLFISIIGFAKDHIRVTGTVLDATGFHNPITFASIKILKTDSTLVTIVSADEYAYDTYVRGADNQKKYTGGFSVELPREGGKYIFLITSIGYKSTSVTVDLNKINKRQFDLKLNPIYLEPTSKMLDEAVVKASKVKFYNRGDTLVYNAFAFNLTEGSMLDALIQQLPDVELKDNGNIYVNGKYVEELLLNGKHFFDNNKQLMLQNLASYAVKNIEVYDKLGRASELAGTDLGDSQYVMDVKLKKQYMVGTMLNVEGGYGSEERHLGRLFAMAFTPTSQYATYFNINNLNDSRKPGQQTTWTPQTMPTGIKKVISGGLDYNVKTTGGRWEVSGNVNAENMRETDQTNVVRTNYLVTGGTYDYQFNQERNRFQALSTSHKIYYKTPKGYGISTEPFFTYQNWEKYSEDVNATFSNKFNEVTTEFIRNIYDGNSNVALACLINRNISMNRQKGHSLSMGTNLWQGIKLPRINDLLVINLFGKYNNRHDEIFNHYDINFGQDPVPEKTANRYFKNYPDLVSNLGAEISYSRVLTRGMTLGVSYRYDHNYRKKTSDLYQLESPKSIEDFMFGKLSSAIDYESALDLNNSYLSRSTDNNHRFELRYTYSTRNFNIQYNLPIILTNQHLHYLRGSVDTTFTRHSVVFDIGNTMIQWNKGKHRISWTWGLKSRTPDMVTMVDFTDDTNPLYIRKGNRDLKNAQQLNTRLYYRQTSREKGSRFQVEGLYSILSNALSQGYTYDTSTGIRRASYYNVNGNWNAQGLISYAKHFGRSLSIGNQLGVGHSTNVDLLGENSSQLSRSKIYNLQFSDQLRFEYRFGKHQLGLNIEGKQDNFTSNRSDFAEQNTWTVKSRLNAVLKLSSNIQFATDFTVYNRRGYTDKVLNTDNFVLNARLTYKLMKGKMLLMLDGYDILHDLSNVSYTMNAQGRTETYRTVLPRYFMFHIQWHFNKSPKQKNK